MLSASATPTTHALILGTMDRPARRRQRYAADAASGAVDRMHQMSYQQLAGLDQATPSTDRAVRKARPVAGGQEPAKKPTPPKSSGEN
jgi:hypothetical protein